MQLASFCAAAPGALLLAGALLGAQDDSCQTRWLPTFGGLPGVDGAVFSLAVFDDGRGPALYAGGNFDTAGGASATNIARWDGQRWSPLGSGVGDANFFVSALAVFDDGRGSALYAGGYFPYAGGLPATNLARWDGTHWSQVGTGVNNGVQALVVFDDGNGPALYAGGWFTAAGARAVSHVARWDGSSWSALGIGLDAVVYALTVFDDGRGPALYAGGVFGLAGALPANRVARWDGASWAPVGNGVNGRVAVLTVFDAGGGPALHAAGIFDRAGGAPANRIARWNGTSWAALGGGLGASGGVAPRVDALAVFDDGSGPALHVTGRFTRAGGAPANHVARWNGTSWAALAGGLSFPATVVGGSFALAVFDRGGGPELHAGGTFTGAGGAPAWGMASWDGASWARPGSAPNDRVRALTVLEQGAGPELVAAGAFTSVGARSTNRIASWDGARWSALGSGLDGEVHALTVFDAGAGPELHAGGVFTAAGGAAANRVARWSGAGWAPLGAGMDGPVLALSAFDDGAAAQLCAGGSFTSAGGLPANGVARWNGASWAPLDAGLSGVVSALLVHDDGGGPALFAGGEFERTGNGVLVDHVARWDGASWQALGSGLDAPVRALAVFDDKSGAGPLLHAGGAFTSAGGTAANHVARWEGTHWTALGDGLDGEVEALAVFDDGAGPALYAGGSFASAGGMPASRSARWDGVRWTPLGAGTSATVHALAVFDDPLERGGPALLAGGAFPSAPDSRDAFLARWQGCPDRTPPVILCPGSISVADPRSGAPGEIVTFAVTSSDERDPFPALVCEPPSGSLFPPGITLVQCKATDAARNQSSCSFAVSVRRKQGK